MPGLRQAGRAGGAVIVTVSRMDGAFGLNNPQNVVSGGLAGLVKTAAKEWPEVCCKALDLSADWPDLDATAKAVVETVLRQGPMEIGLSQQGAATLQLSEKPLAMSFPEGQWLVNFANEKGLSLSAAPSRLLGETAQTFWKALRKEKIGKVYLAYAEMDGGLIHRAQYKKWINELGIPWPYKDEFEVGCTLEHAAYPVSWLQAFFGPVETVTAFSSCQILDKGADVPPLVVNTPDFSVAVLKFVSGPVARLTCSWIALPDRGLRVFGEKGVLCTDDICRPRCPVYIKRYITIGWRMMVAPWKERYALVCPQRTSNTHANSLVYRLQPRTILRALRARSRHLRKRVDFCLGIVELDAAIRERRPSRLSAEFCLHTTEVILAIHSALQTGSAYRLKTSFDPIDPMPWANP